jgi:hypothetical protein
LLAIVLISKAQTHGTAESQTNMVGLRKAAIFCLVGAILLEKIDEWVVPRRHISLGVLGSARSAILRSSACQPW